MWSYTYPHAGFLKLDVQLFCSAHHLATRWRHSVYVTLSWPLLSPHWRPLLYIFIHVVFSLWWIHTGSFLFSTNSKNSLTVNPRFLFFPCCLKANVLPPYFFCKSLSPGSWWDLPSCSTANPNCPNLQQKQISQHSDMRIYKAGAMLGIFSAFSWDRNSWSSLRGDSTSSSADGKWINAHSFPELSVQAFPCVTKKHGFCLPWETSDSNRQ